MLPRVWTCEVLIIEEAITVKGLSKTYGKSKAVDDISFGVPKGTIFGLLGPNGAGKTTTIKILTCQLPPTAGICYVTGRGVTNDAMAIKKRIGVVFEEQNLYDNMTAAENLDFFRRLYGADKKVIDEVLKLVGMQEHRKKKVRTFSKGMKQKIMIARALLNDPEVLFLDEPTSGLDPHSARDLKMLIRHLRDTGKTVLLTTHNMEEADFLCDELAIINKGCIVAQGTPKRLKKEYGKNVLKIETLSGEIYETPLNTEDGALTYGKLSAEKKILTAHSEEATLEEVFIRLTGERWSA